MLHQRFRRRFSRYLDLTNEVNDVIENQNSPEIETANVTSAPQPSSSNGHTCGLPTINETCCEESPVVDIEDILGKAPPTIVLQTDEGYVYVHLLRLKTKRTFHFVPAVVHHKKVCAPQGLDVKGRNANSAVE